MLVFFQEQQQHMSEVYEQGLRQQQEEHARQQAVVKDQLQQEYQAAFKEKEEFLKKGFEVRKLSTVYTT